MKKSILVFLFCFVTLFSNSQNNLSFGVRGSFGIPMWKWNVYPEPSASGYGFSIGGLADLRFSQKVFLSTELDYSRYNFNVSANNGYNVNFLELPITINADLGKGLISYFGLGIGVKMSDDVYWDSNDNTLNQISILKNYKSEYFKSVNVFFPVGLEYKFDSGLFFDLRMKININDMGDNSVKFAKGFNDVSLGIGFKFN